MRVLLIYSNQSRELVPAPPVGLSYVASATRAAGHEVRLLDLAFADDLLAELAAAIDEYRPEIVGLSVRNIDNVIHQRLESPLAALREQVVAITERAAAAVGRPVPVVLGGPAISILGSRTLDVFGVDYAVVGEGEETFPALIEAIAQGRSPAGIPGVCHRLDGSAVANPVSLLGGFSNSGMQGWIDWRRYERGGGTWPIQTKRGCPLKCVYCAYPLVEGRRFRLREPGEVVDEIERVLRDVGPRTFEFVDSTFNVPAANGMAICEELIRRRVRANFTAMGVNPLDVPAELFPLMKRAGFNSAMITAEAGCDVMLENLGKGFTMREVHRCRELVTASGLKSMWFFMLGGPGETMATCEESIRYAETHLASRRFLAVFFAAIRILPGTRLADRLTAEGHLPAGDDLAEGRFYLSPAVDESELLARLHRAVIANPSIVQAAEGGSSGAQSLLYRALHLMGVAPPYWRYLPELLRFPPLRVLRNRFPSVVAGSNRLDAWAAMETASAAGSAADR
jgi:hypothetical protein